MRSAPNQGTGSSRPARLRLLLPTLIFTATIVGLQAVFLVSPLASYLIGALGLLGGCAWIVFKRFRQ